MEWNRKVLTAAVALLVAAAGAAHAQTGPSLRSDQNPYAGSVAAGTPGPELALTMQDAIQRGLKANLGLLLTDRQLAATRGARSVALSRLLPDINAGLRDSSQQINLAAFGFNSFPGVKPVVGPFNVFDARVSLSQAILNLRAIDSSRASDQNLRAAEYQYKDARDAVTLLVTAFYLQAQASESRIATTEAQVAVSEALFRQAREFKSAGTVPAIDVLRAQVELQAQRHRLIAAQNDFEKQKLQLAQAIGLPDGQAFHLADRMAYSPAAAPPFDEALKLAYESRMDYRALEARVRAADYLRKGAAAQRYPTAYFNGDYGVIGRNPANNHGTYTAVFSLNVPVFDGGRIKGEVEQADAALRQQQAQLDGLRGRIAYEIRTALLDLKAARDQVDAAASAVSLGEQQVEQARDRFAAGVANNLETVQAQEALAGAQENYTSSLFAYNIARAQLARAMGGMEKNQPATPGQVEQK